MNPERTADGTVFVEMEDGVRVEVKPTVEVEVVRNEPEVPEPPKNHWEANGFLADIARVCTDLESEPERFLFTSGIRQIIETVSNARRVEDFDRYNDSQIHDYIQTLRNQVPQIERNMMTFVNQLTRARAVQVDSIDFI